MSWLESIKSLFGGSVTRPKRFNIPDKQKEYVIRVNNANGRSPYFSRFAFHYPETGYVEMPGYRSGLDLSRFSRKDDGMGLFGLWRGLGQPLTMLQYAEKDSVYCLLEVRRDELVVVNKGREVKFPRGNVLYSGELPAIMEHLRRLATQQEHLSGLKTLQFYYDLFIECGCDRNVFFPELKRRGLGYDQVQMGIQIADYGQRWVRDEQGGLYMDFIGMLGWD